MRLSENCVIFKIFDITKNGFLREKDAHIAITKLVETTNECLGSNKCVWALFLDLRNCQPRYFLTETGNVRSQSSNSLHFKSYLQSRSQYIFINGQESQCRPINTSVPQGSVFGPLLFNMHISQHFLFDERMVLYADDKDKLTINENKCTFLN